MGRSPITRIARGLVTATVALLAVACGDGPTEGRTSSPGIRAAAGGGITDTVLSQPLQALVVEVRGSGGKLAINTVVRFEPITPADSARRNLPALFVCPLSTVSCGGDVGYYPGYPYYPGSGGVATDTTDADGRAKVVYRLGVVAGTARVRVTVPEFGLADSVSFTVLPGGPAHVRMNVSDTALVVGGRVTLTARVVDRFDNPRTERATMALSGGAGVVEFAPETGAAVARDIGTAYVVGRAGAGVDSAAVRVVPNGRLVVWEPDGQRVRMINFDGSNSRTLLTGVHSNFGVFPRFDAARGRVTLHTGDPAFGGAPRTGVLVDTSGADRRNLAAAGLTNITAVRALADGSVLLVGQKAPAPGEYGTQGGSLWRADADGAVTEVLVLPDFSLQYGGADISPDGARVAYVAAGAGCCDVGPLQAVEVSTGRVTTLAAAGRSPRWSPTGDRVAYLDQSGTQYYYGLDGALAVVGADGGGQRALSAKLFSPGLTWSPDGAYVAGRNSVWQDGAGLRVVRARDGVDVLVPVREQRSQFGAPQRVTLDLYQPDWR